MCKISNDSLVWHILTRSVCKRSAKSAWPSFTWSACKRSANSVWSSFTYSACKRSAKSTWCSFTWSTCKRSAKSTWPSFTWSARLCLMKSLLERGHNVTYLGYRGTVFTERFEQRHLVNVLQSSSTLKGFKMCVHKGIGKFTQSCLHKGLKRFKSKSKPVWKTWGKSTLNHEQQLLVSVIHVISEVYNFRSCKNHSWNMINQRKESCDNKDIYCLLKFTDSTLNGSLRQ